MQSIYVDHLRKGYKYPRREKDPFKCGFYPELNTSTTMGLENASYDQSFIRVMNG